jgi:hypothetical protein
MAQQSVQTVSPELLNAVRFRSIGPTRGGRVVAVTGHPTKKATFYFGADLALHFRRAVEKLVGGCTGHCPL